MGRILLEGLGLAIGCGIGYKIGEIVTKFRFGRELMNLGKSPVTKRKR